MANTLRIKRRAAGGAAGAPASLAAAELAYNEQDNILYYGKGDVGGFASTVVAIAGSGAYSGTAHSHSLSSLTVPTADVAMGGHKLTGLATPAADTDAATKAYVHSVAQGLSPKAAVRVATTAAGTLASSFANASVVDGVTLATGDRILIKNQAISQENGIYTVNVSGAPTRAADADAWAELPGAYFFVQQGTANAEMGFVCTSDAGGLIGTTAINFQQFSGAGQISASGGLQKSGNTISIAFDTTAPLVAGTAAAGTATVAARRDHVHPKATYTAADVGALTPTGSAAALTGFPTLNQNTTGSAGSLSAAIRLPVASTSTFTAFSINTPGFFGGYDIKASGFTSASLRFLTGAGAVESILTGGSTMTLIGSAGTYTVGFLAKNFESAAPTGTIPLVVTSTTMCTNLNADMVDGVHLAGLLQTSSTIDGGTF